MMNESLNVTLISIFSMLTVSQASNITHKNNNIMKSAYNTMTI